jgi:hypothetical protein
MRAIELSGMNLSEVSEVIGERRTALGTRISRLKRGAPEKISLDKAVGYARAMHVSVAWLCAGIGDPWDAPFAFPESEVLRRLPEPARRAVLAISALGDVDGIDAVVAAESCELSGNEPPGDWLAAIQSQLSSVSARSDTGKRKTRASPRRGSR